jgi:hypothetical protein
MKGDYDKAKKSYLAAIKLSPGDAFLRNEYPYYHIHHIINRYQLFSDEKNKKEEALQASLRNSRGP